MTALEITVVAIVSYLLGSIPTAVWIGKSKYGVDVREHGSKNAGATNTFRVLGKKAGSVVLSIDVAKGILAVTCPLLLKLGGVIHPNGSDIVNLQVVAAIVAVLGHIFPLFAGFKGGKGVATSLGVIIGLHPAAAGICLVIFLLIFIVSNYVSLGAIISAICFPLAVLFIFDEKSDTLQVFSVILALAVIAAHRKNISRLLKGEENKMNLFHK